LRFEGWLEISRTGILKVCHCRINAETRSVRSDAVERERRFNRETHEIHESLNRNIRLRTANIQGREWVRGIGETEGKVTAKNAGNTKGYLTGGSGENEGGGGKHPTSNIKHPRLGIGRGMIGRGMGTVSKRWTERKKVGIGPRGRIRHMGGRKSWGRCLHLTGGNGENRAGKKSLAKNPPLSDEVKV